MECIDRKGNAELLSSQMHSTLTSSWELGRGIIWATATGDRTARLCAVHISRTSEFLIMAKDVLDSLGEDQDACQKAAHQFIYDVLVELAGHVNLPTSLVERKIF